MTGRPVATARGRLSAALAFGARPRPLIRANDPRQQVLITGAGGLIGAIVRDGLGEARAVHGIDRRAGVGVDRVVDLRRLRSAAPLFAGIDAVVDLAADSRATAPWGSVLHNNVAATVTTFEAARLGGASRVIFASSNHVVGLYERDEPYASIVAGRVDDLNAASILQLRSDTPIRPDGPYAAGKAFGEAVARYYAEEHGLSAICLRLGTVNRDNRPLSPRHRATLLTHRDLIHLVECCLDAPPSLRFAVLYGVSANTWRFWDLEEAREAVGFEPRDNASDL